MNITIKRRDGKVVKSFSFIGPNAVVEALLWIWRDLFVSLSAYGTPFAREQMPEMLEDIETLLGWPALERLLYGGKNCEMRFSCRFALLTYSSDQSNV